MADDRGGYDVKDDRIPKIPAPAERALASAGVEGLRHLTRFTEDELLALHGFGPKALDMLRTTLAERGLGFRR